VRLLEFPTRGETKPGIRFCVRPLRERLTYLLTMVVAAMAITRSSHDYALKGKVTNLPTMHWKAADFRCVGVRDRMEIPGLRDRVNPSATVVLRCDIGHKYRWRRAETHVGESGAVAEALRCR
jgi:hypothetical protein